MEIHSSLSIVQPQDRSRTVRPDPVDAQTGKKPYTVEPASVPAFVRMAPTEDTLNKAHRFHSEAIYDQPQGKAQHAVTAYMSFEREQKRDAIRDMMGVDLYA
ncbi:hypothetical protein HHX48_16760 [Salinimonas sp. HHU 13199]|uniref:Chromosome partitioning protein ParA n=1 Tax=Salinimonas profundi TaxID=2729140 RepID=A0ABR8LT98_9ALTE|nr:hypothetical protein [Salinimonas profundi]MBD3587390.1 hypothetical protein [Salinimonas profundi]